MARVQLALNVSDLEAAIDFYTRLLGTEPAKRRDGYANFAVESPPLKLVLFENPDATEALNHLGVEVADTSEVAATQTRLTDDGMTTRTEEAVDCCHAIQDKVWVEDPDGRPWEVYTVLADSETAPGTTCGPDGCGVPASSGEDVAEHAGTALPVATGCC